MGKTLISYLCSLLIHVTILGVGGVFFFSPLGNHTPSPALSSINILWESARPFPILGDKPAPKIPTSPSTVLSAAPSLKKASPKLAITSSFLPEHPASSSLQAKAPTSLYTPPPAYPEDCRLSSIEGQVLLSLFIDNQGQVISVQVITSSGHPSLDQAAIDGVKNWRYAVHAPSTHHLIQLNIPINFQLTRQIEEF